MEDKKFEEMYQQFTSYQAEVHKKNQRKISIGLRVSIWLPLIFLIISFMTSGSKLVFLILWIVSLFGVAFYLIYTEFQDHKLMEKMKEFGIVDEEEEVKALIGDKMVEAEAVVYEKMDAVDERIAEERKRIETELAQEKEKLSERVNKMREIKKDNKGGSDE